MPPVRRFVGVLVCGNTAPLVDYRQAGTLAGKRQARALAENRKTGSLADDPRGGPLFGDFGDAQQLAQGRQPEFGSRCEPVVQRRKLPFVVAEIRREIGQLPIVFELVRLGGQPHKRHAPRPVEGRAIRAQIQNPVERHPGDFLPAAALQQILIHAHGPGYLIHGLELAADLQIAVQAGRVHGQDLAVDADRRLMLPAKSQHAGHELTIRAPLGYLEVLPEQRDQRVGHLLVVLGGKAQAFHVVDDPAANVKYRIVGVLFRQLRQNLVVGQRLAQRRFSGLSRLVHEHRRTVRRNPVQRRNLPQLLQRVGARFTVQRLDHCQRFGFLAGADTHVDQQLGFVDSRAAVVQLRREIGHQIVVGPCRLRGGDQPGVQQAKL